MGSPDPFPGKEGGFLRPAKAGRSKEKPPPPRPDLVKAQLQALNFAQTERKLRAGSGRRSTFLTRGQGIGGNTALGQ